ncbi:MAG: methylenetetrahydrofolate reductase, partial [Rhodobiaceae bacterium]|nr:methylenetetrahydrofolate reductase [Rhodobiaceae bacterium]
MDEIPGDPSAALPDLPGHSSRGRLERVLRRGEFAVTAELNPPDSADPQEVYDRAAIFEGWVDGINATDGSGANCHMS